MKRAILALRSLLLYGGLSRKKYSAIIDDVHNQNGKTMRTYSGFTILIFTVFIFLRYYFDREINEAVILYIFFAILSFCVHLSITFVMKSKSKAASALMGSIPYAMIGVSLTYCCYIAWLFPDHSIGGFVGVVGIVPILFCARPVNVNAMIIVFSCVCEYILFRYHTHANIEDDAINLVIIAFLSIVSSTEVNSIRLRSFSVSHELKMSAERDALTGCNNRFKFISDMESKKYRENTPSVVYIDINGLHDINNKYGHAAGDLMIKTVIKSVAQYFDISNVYRVGGDEIVVLNTDRTLESITVCLASIDVYLADNNYHIAHGVCFRDETKSIAAAVDIAEKRMYDDKRIYYEKNHIDRRTNNRD